MSMGKAIYKTQHSLQGFVGKPDLVLLQHNSPSPQPHNQYPCAPYQNSTTMSESARMRTARAFISSFATVDISVLKTILSKDFTETILPASIPVPAMDQPGYIAHMSKLNTVVTGFPFTILDIVESESSNSVWLYGTAGPLWRDEAKGDGEVEGGWDFKGEYVFMLWMDESGEKLVRSMEMVDSKAVERMLGLYAKALANVGSK
jgi:hypothetical protein